MSGDAKREVAKAFEAEHAAVVESRGPAPIKHVGKGRSRPIIVTDADGKPKRIATHDRLLEGLLERDGVEAAVEGKPPQVVRCVDCGGLIAVKNGGIPLRCAVCKKRNERAKERARRAKKRAQDPEVFKAKERAKYKSNPTPWRKWYAANREAVLARMRVKREATKAPG